MATNLLIKSEGKYNFTERYLLPNARQNYNELVEKAHKDDAEPLVIAGPDGIWWNDDLVSCWNVCTAIYILLRFANGKKILTPPCGPMD